jgi:archaellum component FlaF (FlaF/FlaG flagellin family)
LDKVIVTALLVIGGVVSAMLVFNSIYPTLGQTSDAFTSMENRVNDQLKTEIKIVYGAQSNGAVQIWVKNIGSLRITALEASDVFFGPEGNFARIPYGVGTPHWEYVVENGTDWTPSATLQITIVGYSPLNPGRYYTKVVLANGVSDDYILSW